MYNLQVYILMCEALPPTLKVPTLNAACLYRYRFIAISLNRCMAVSLIVSLYRCIVVSLYRCINVTFYRWEVQQYVMNKFYFFFWKCYVFSTHMYNFVFWNFHVDFFKKKHVKSLKKYTKMVPNSSKKSLWYPLGALWGPSWRQDTPRATPRAEFHSKKFNF